MLPDQPLTQQDVAGIADYARIALTTDELAQMTDYLNDTIAMLAPIRAYDLEGVEPTYHPIGGLANVMAEDVADQADRALSVDAALCNAASTVGRAFRVPSILGEGGGDRA